MTETIQTQIPQCPHCQEKIKIRIHSERRWHCKSCGHYFTFPKPQKTCPTCGKIFEPSHGKQRYCSEICYPKRTTAKVKTCPVCGVEFHGMTKTCSLKCYAIASEQRK